MEEAKSEKSERGQDIHEKIIVCRDTLYAENVYKAVLIKRNRLITRYKIVFENFLQSCSIPLI